MPKTTATRTGLYTTQAVAVPLTGVSIDAHISSLCARVSVTGRYENRESNPIEAVYVFPLDEGAAVCGFEAIIDGTLVVGEVKEREQAFQMYDDAMERGDGAFLLDEERPDVFQASVGNLPPGKEALLKLTYVTELTVADGSLRFTIPTTVSPRFAPAEDTIGVGRPDSEALNPPLAWQVPYGLDLSIRLAMGGTIARIESPSHPISVTMNGSDAAVSLSQREVAMDRDFVLSVDCVGLDAPQAWIERNGDGAQAVAVAFVPKLGNTPTPCDVTFLIDRSGSMEGTSIKEVRNALQLCLRSMIPGCHFNIVGFGSTYEPLFSKSRAYDESSLAEASAHVGALAANLGGTVILPALEHVLQTPGHRELPRQIVVLTDGEVTNTDAVIALAKRHAARARIFTFGIGAGASHHLVNGLARAGGGAAEFIHPGERIEPKVLRQFGRLLSPALTDVQMHWGGLDATQAPSVVPPVFAGGRVLVYAFVKEIANGTRPGQIQLTATSPSGPVSFDVAFDPSRVVTGHAVATLAARARIRELEESPEWTAARGSRQRERKESRCRNEIIALSIKYGLISRETSFVAIERRETPVLGDVQLRRVPIALTTGWGGLEHQRIGSTLTLSAPAASLRQAYDAVASAEAWSPAPRASSAPGMLSRLKRWAVGDPEAEERMNAEMRREAGSWKREAGSGKLEAGSGKLEADLIALQRADGSWDLTADLARAIGRELADLESALDGASGGRDEIRKAWATALALAWLEEHAQDTEDEWRMLAAKARRWLDRVVARPPHGGSWTDASGRLLAARLG
jgi:Ca-activated chloride channel family protein